MKAFKMGEQGKKVPSIVLAAIQGNIDEIEEMMFEELNDVDGIIDCVPSEKRAEMLNAYHPTTERTALIEAAARGFAGIVEILASENEVDLDATDKWGNTALMWASEKGYADIVETLISFGANVNVVAEYEAHTSQL